MTWTTDSDRQPEWLEDLTRYQLDQSRALELGIWPRETALRERAISSTIVAELATYFTEVFAQKRASGEIDVFPILSSRDLVEISRRIHSAILAGGWLQSQRALDYLDNHPRKE